MLNYQSAEIKQQMITIDSRSQRVQDELGNDDDIYFFENNPLFKN